MPRPILVLQMQRMGDLVLSFPLLAWLARLYPDNPLWVVAEEFFFSGLMPVSPNAVFFPPAALERMKNQPFELVVNLSHRPEAARLAPHVRAQAWFGARESEGGDRFVEGDWQLYRSSLTFNNRHNLFHWADLNALDVVPHALMADTAWLAPKPASAAGSGARIGLFLGASEPEKRPQPQFWADLAHGLLQRGQKPVFLGGEAEKPLGSEAARLARLPALDLTGRFTVPELVTFLRGLDLLVTPDTGPMHLAAWLGVPVFNLSMGPVNPWETGPYQSGHLVAQSAMSCAGCWSCARPALACRETFAAPRVAAMIRALSKPAGMKPPVARGLSLAKTGRRDGLYYLNFQSPPPARQGLGDFWRAAFAWHLGYKGSSALGTEEALKTAHGELAALAPTLANPLRAGMRDLLRRFQKDALRARHSLPEAFWRQSPPLLRPLTGYLLPFLQNANYARPALGRALRFLELLASL